MVAMKPYVGADGRKFAVPEDELETFREEVPDAREAVSFQGPDRRRFYVPTDEVDAFQAEVPDAEPMAMVKSRDGGVFGVALSERDDFLREYRTGERFAEERAEQKRRAEEQAAPPASQKLGEMVKAGAQAAGDYYKDLFTQPAAGLVYDFPEQVWSLVNVVAPKDSDVQKKARDTLEEVRLARESATWDDPTMSGLASVPGSAMRSMGPQVLLAVATRGVSRFVTPLLFMAQRGQDIYDQGREKGWDEDKARRVAWTAAMIEGVPEAVSSALGAGGAAGRIGRTAWTRNARKQMAETGMEALRKVLQTSGVEGATEFVQEGAGAWLEKRTGLRPDADWLAEGGMAALAGALAGWLMEGGSLNMNKRQQQAFRQRLEQAQAAQAAQEAQAQAETQAGVKQEMEAQSAQRTDADVGEGGAAGGDQGATQVEQAAAHAGVKQEVEAQSAQRTDADVGEGGAAGGDQGATQVEQAAAPVQEQAAAPAPMSVEEQAKEGRRRGSVDLAPRRLTLETRARLRRVGRLFDPNRRVGKKVYNLYNQMRNDLSAAGVRQRIEAAEMRGVLDALSERHSRENVARGLLEVQEGRMTPADFAQRYGLEEGGTTQKTLEKIVEMTNQRSKRIVKWAREHSLTPEQVKEMEFYQTRAYMVHVLGEKYDAPQGAKRAAMVEFEAGIADAVERMTTQATELRGARRPVDVVTWLETGDRRLLQGMGKQRMAEARLLRKQYLDLRHVIDRLGMEGDNVTAALNAKAMADAAANMVETDLYAQRQRNPMVSALRERHLEGARRALYGEITDPVARQRITAAAQESMLAEMTFYERLFDEAEGIVWARAPSRERMLIEQLGDPNNNADRMKYGAMVGYYVTPEFKALIESEPNKGGVYRAMGMAYFGPMSVQRMAKLLNPKTIARNWGTALTGFALQTGDVGLAGYWGDLARGHKLAVDYLAGKQWALEVVEDLAKRGVFDPSGTSWTMDMQAAMENLPGRSRLKRAGKKITEAYMTIDLPTKYAAYVARRRLFAERLQREGVDAATADARAANMAAEHVQLHYQNPSRTPMIVGKAAGVGIGDYLSYPYDATRIAVNGLRFAVSELRQGRAGAMTGFVASRALWALTSAKATQELSELAGKIYQWVADKLRTEDPEDEEAPPEIEGMDEGTLVDMRELVAPYDARVPLLAWREERGGKLHRVSHMVLGGQTAHALEDGLIAALQSPYRGESFLEGVVKGLADYVELGMYPSTIAKTIGGESPAGRRTPTGKGLWHAATQEDPERGRIVTDALLAYAIDLLPEFPGKMVRDLRRREVNKRAGVENVGMFAMRDRTTGQIVRSNLRMVRTYAWSRSEMNRQVLNHIREYQEPINRTRNIQNAVAGMQLEKGGVTPNAADSARAAQDARPAYLRAVADKLKAAQNIAPEWYDPSSAGLLLEQAGFTAWDRAQILGLMTGTSDATDYIPNPQINPWMSGAYQRMFEE